jgi:hypothetical protein
MSARLAFNHSGVDPRGAIQATCRLPPDFFGAKFVICRVDGTIARWPFSCSQSTATFIGGRPFA